eukprot:2864232-Rhodomonas_salina.1
MAVLALMLFILRRKRHGRCSPGINHTLDSSFPVHADSAFIDPQVVPTVYMPSPFSQISNAPRTADLGRMEDGAVHVSSWVNASVPLGSSGALQSDSFAAVTGSGRWPDPSKEERQVAGQAMVAC